METVNMKDIISIKPGCKTAIKVAHFAKFAPNSAGISGTAIDMVLAERAAGIDSCLIDYDGTSKPCIVGYERSGVVTVGPSMAKTADLIVRHSAVPKAIKAMGIPIVMCLHGRPEYTFLLDYYKKNRVVGEYLKCAKDPQYAGFITFWKQHLDYLNILLPNNTIDYVPAMVDLDFYKPTGVKYDFAEEGGTPNILIADMFREDVNPFNMLVAVAIFKQKYCPEAKAHIYGLQRTTESPVKDLIDAMRVAGVVGEAKPLVTDMERVYRSCDILITPHVIATRVIREALASGLPIVGGNGNPYTPWQANHLDVHGFAEEMYRCWDDIEGFKEISISTSREVAENDFSVKQAGEAILPIYKRILKEHKTIKPIEIRTKPTIYNFVAYTPESMDKDLGGTYNKYMELIGDDDWACFLDHDAMWTTSDWYKQIEHILVDNPKYGLLTACTNRIGNPQQKIAGLDETHDIMYHREIGRKLQFQGNSVVMDVTNSHCISGVVMIISKAAWKKAGGFQKGFLGVDNKMHQSIVKSGGKVGICKGLYVYHTYRADPDSELKPVKVAG